jgi:hypothetical protein
VRKMQVANAAWMKIAGRQTFFFAAIVAATLDASAAEVVFWGKPTRQCTMNGGSAACKDLSPEQQEAYRCVVVQEGGQFRWKSREGVVLQKVTNPQYVTYVADTGAGLIKIGRDGSYVEVLHFRDAVLGYWGTSDGR